MFSLNDFARSPTLGRARGGKACRLTPRISRPPDRRQICVWKFDDWLVGRLHAFVRRRRSGTVYGPPHAVQVELRSVRTHVPEALLQNRARILIRFDRAKIARERAMLCADALELLRIRNKGRDLLPVPQRARPAEQRCRSCMRELRNFEIEERAPVARPAPAHAGPAQASLQDAEGQDLEILVVRARSLAGKAAAALLLCEHTLPGRAVAHSIFRHMNDEDGTLRRPGSAAGVRATRAPGSCRRVLAGAIADLKLDSKV